MIDWEDLSLNEIIFKWETFLEDRESMTPGTNRVSSHHLTVLERESLINHLILRLENARECIEN
jgi:hypothetical protein